MKFTSRIAIVCLSCAALMSPLPARGAEQVVEEPARMTPVLYDVDVVVVGGGLSGIGAAVGAARAGAKTLVIERTGYMGSWTRATGLANRLAIGGSRPTLEEGVLLDITKKMVEMKFDGFPDLPTALKLGELSTENPENIAHAIQEVVLESGAAVMYFTTFVDTVVTDDKIQAVIVETPTQRGAVRGKVFIDCTGLATVAYKAGAPTKQYMDNMGLAAAVAGVDKGKFVAYAQATPEKGTAELKEWVESKIGSKITDYNMDALMQGNPDNLNTYPWQMWWYRMSGQLGEKFRDAVDKGEMPLFYRVGKEGIVSVVEGFKVDDYEYTVGGVSRIRTFIGGLDPTDFKAVTEAHIASTRYIFTFTQYLRKNMPGFEKARVDRMAETTFNRAGRSIENGFPSVTDLDFEEKGATHDDTIVVFQRNDNLPHEVPYKAMVPLKIDNLLAVGKSSAGAENLRKHSLTSIMGQAAGIAAAMSINDGVSVRDIDVRKLQADLRKAGVKIPEK